MTETDDQVSVLAMNKFTFVVSLLAGALGIALVLINIFDLSGRPP